MTTFFRLPSLFGCALVALLACTPSSDGPTTGDAQPARILLIGLDGADWKIIDPLIEQGRLPNLARLKREGVSGPLRTLQDIPLSPVIWTSIATGKGPSKHGITWFLVDTPDGKRVPVRSNNRRVKAIWNILAEYHRAAGIVGWWASAPAENVRDGVIASDALGFHGFGRTGQGLPDTEKVYPPERFEEFAALVPPVNGIGFDLARDFFHIEADEFARRARTPGAGEDVNPTDPLPLFQEYMATTLGYTAIAKRLLRREGEPLDLVAVYYESTDSMSHLFMKYAPPRLPWIEEKDFARYRDVVDQTYEFVDARLGEVLRDIDDSWNVVVVSDHGFRTGSARPKSTDTIDIRGAHLDHDPHGIFIARGPLFRAGATLEGASVLDVTPTLLHALGFPVAEDMDGHVLEEAFHPSFLAAHPIETLKTYEQSGFELTNDVREPTADFAADEAMARLAALGYVGSEPKAPETPREEFSSPEQHNNLGRIFLSQGKLQEARREFEAALRISPDNPEAHTNLGVLHRVTGQTQRALLAFTQALEVDPNHIPALIQLAQLRQARGELPIAEALYRQVLAIQARLPEPHLALGDVLLRQGKVDEALTTFQHVVELDPRLPEGHYNLGVAYGALGKHDEARQAYLAVLELVPEHTLALNNLGDLHVQANAYDEALALFRRAADSSPEHMESRYNLGSILMQQGKAEAAVPWLRAAAELAPEHEVVQLRFAEALLASGAIEEAKRRYTVLVRMFPTNGMACIQLARIAVRQGNPDEAQTWLQHAWKRAGQPAERFVRGDEEFRALDLDAVFR
ncbi:MAG: tetratricopeptide repeat protein [Planctomycetes bacterium]|nr:tetratricopeptide repeat protein [Planctomycetota bacterium]